MKLKLRLLALKCICIYVFTDESYVSSSQILKYCETNGIGEYFTEKEKIIMETERGKAKEQYFDTIGWRLENAWPLAWFF